MYLAILALVASAFLLGFAYYTTRPSRDDAGLIDSFHRAQAGTQIHNTWEASDGR